MRASLFTLIAVGSLLTSTIANPVPGNVAITRRSDDAALSLLNNLYATVQTYTGTINSTVASLSSSSTAADNATASTIVNTAVSGLTAAIKAATMDAKDLSVDSRLMARQINVTVVAVALENILLDISGALNLVISSLGLTSILGFLDPLVSGLSGLILALEVLVDGLVAAVVVLLDGLLTGLSVALADLDL